MKADKTFVLVWRKAINDFHLFPSGNSFDRCLMSFINKMTVLKAKIKT